MNDAATDSKVDLLDAPTGTGVFGMVLTIASLTMLFAAGLILYAIMRSKSPDMSVHLPVLLWFSSAAVVASSSVLQYSSISLSANHPRAFRNSLLLSLLLGIAFICIQIPALPALVREHQSASAQKVYVYSLVLFLVILHAAHAFVGLCAFVTTTWHAFHGKYSAERDEAVRRLAMYWHFLAGVWIVMFSVFWLS